MSFSKKEQDEIVDQIAAILRQEVRVNLHYVLSEVQLGSDTREGRILFWRAVEQVQKTDNIVYGPMRGQPFHYERKTDSGIIERATRQKKAGQLKKDRAVSKLLVVVEVSKDNAAKEKASRTAARWEAETIRRRGFGT